MKTSQRGFILPWTLFALTILTFLAATGFTVAWMEVRASAAHETGVHAFHTANAGLSTVLARSGMPAGPTETITLTHGSARIRYRTLLRLPGRGVLMSIESAGDVIERGLLVRREVARVAWMGESPVLPFALGSMGPITASLATGFVSGMSVPGCALPAGAGVTAWGPVSTGAVFVTGNPAVDLPPATVSPTALTGIRWGQILSATAPPDAVVPPDPWPLPGSVPSGWPYIRVVSPGPLGPGHSGRGVLVADGDLDLADGFVWEGILLTGGTLRVFGNVVLRGSVFAGLDPARTSTVDLGDANLSIQHDPCAVAAAAARLEPYAAAIPGTWFERW